MPHLAKGGVVVCDRYADSTYAYQGYGRQLNFEVVQTITKFATQSQIDSFQINYPGCTEILGDVTVQSNDIINLNGLSVLTSIEGHLQIGYLFVGNPALTSLTGLEGLTSIGGDLRIINNTALTSLTGLDNVVTVNGVLGISNNSVLTSLTGWII